MALRDVPGAAAITPSTPTAGPALGPPLVRDVMYGPIAWREAGDAGRVAVFFHGLGGNRTSWEPQLHELSRRRRCCAWDAPGYGRSPGRITSLPELAAVAAAWIRSLASSPVDVVGLSFGGMVAQHLTLDHPQLVRSLALLDTSPAFGLDGLTTPESWLKTRIEPLHDARTPRKRFEPIVDAMVGGHCSATIKALVVESMQAIPTASLEAACRALVAHDTRERLHDIAVPTLVLVGAEDEETPPAYARVLHSRIRGARYVEVTGSGHISNLEAPDVVNAELTRLWNQAERAAV